MCWRSGLALVLIASSALADDGYILGLGLEGDSADGLSAAAIGDFTLTKNTWLSTAIARSEVDLERAASPETWYADLGVDHWFDPLGVRAGVAYWGDSDALESKDWRGSVYWRNEKVMLSGDYEYRDFRFELPATDFFPGRTVRFSANGVGLSMRFELTDKVSLGLRGMDYDYGVNLRLDRNRGILDLLSFSRLSLINSLVDYRATATLGLVAGNQNWSFDVTTWQGEVDGSTTRSATVRLLTPMGDRTDIEFGLGVDNSDLYGSVTFLSVFLYFYGGT